MMTENYLDDRVNIPEDIKKMSIDELEAEIARLEYEEKSKRNSLNESAKKATA